MNIILNYTVHCTIHRPYILFGSVIRLFFAGSVRVEFGLADLNRTSQPNHLNEDTVQFGLVRPTEPSTKVRFGLKMLGSVDVFTVHCTLYTVHFTLMRLFEYLHCTLIPISILFNSIILAIKLK